MKSRPPVWAARPRTNPTSLATRAAKAQAQSLNTRKVKVTLPPELPPRPGGLRK